MWDQALQTEEALTSKDHVAELYVTAVRLSNPGPMDIASRVNQVLPDPPFRRFALMAGKCLLQGGIL